MPDKEILVHINSLVDTEHTLRNRDVGHPLSEDEPAKLDSLEVALDQLWELLNQRRARRDAGLNPDDARLRDAKTVEGYLQ